MPIISLVQERGKIRQSSPSKHVVVGGIIITTLLLWNVSSQLWIGGQFFPARRDDDDAGNCNNHESSLAEVLLDNALTKIKARNAYLYPGNTDKSQWGWKAGGPERFQKVSATKSPQVIHLALQPIVACPWSLRRTNYVSETVPEPHFDGGKWTCGLEEISKWRQRQRQPTIAPPPPPCIVYSFGSNGDDFFEADVLQQNPSCEIHIFDPTSGDPPSSWEGKYHFHRTGLCVGNATTFTLEGTNTNTKGRDNVQSTHFPCQSVSNHMKNLGHTHVDILKADVEGMEWELLTTKGFDGMSNIGQLLIELHFWHLSSPQHLSELLRDHIIPLERLGYFLSTSEPVAAEIDAYEVTFLNVNWNPRSAFQTLPSSSHTKQFFDASMYPTTPNVVL